MLPGVIKLITPGSIISFSSLASSTLAASSSLATVSVVEAFPANSSGYLFMTSCKCTKNCIVRQAPSTLSDRPPSPALCVSSLCRLISACTNSNPVVEMEPRRARF
ncbi:hypothetical protein PR002_g31033 [Phytophthora rubi]|uniref:Uncharacterized protein n=1 Tax=Phytophthora rubi TaxID=129364 RepID=A0A6A3GKN1_9STRA|nr:hypothetical protein PR002_g31033 [Phytophthora rubi]